MKVGPLLPKLSWK